MPESPFKEFPDHFPDFVEHIDGQAPGVRVLAAGMVGTDKVFSTWQGVDGGMGKDKIGLWQGKYPQDGLKGNASERHKDLRLDQYDFPLQVLLAVCYFLPGGFVLWWNAAADGSGIEIRQL